MSDTTPTPETAVIEQEIRDLTSYAEVLEQLTVQCSWAAQEIDTAEAEGNALKELDQSIHNA